MTRFGRSSGCARCLGLLLFAAAACSKAEPESKRLPLTPPAPQVAVTPSVQAVTPASVAARVGDPGLPPRRAIAGIAGFQSSSRIVFEREPDKVHTLATTFLFPQRTRLCLALEQDKRRERVILYRAGARGFSIDQSGASSKEIVGEDLERLLLQTELRRALFLWPDGFAWNAEGRARGAELSAKGELVLQLGPDGRPLSIASFAPKWNSDPSARSASMPRTLCTMLP